jgi:fatty-acid desaturase|tara:strand:- start:345 stop:638 length:294 start_codon:yes stop_codon:yes gene_type:complete
MKNQFNKEELEKSNRIFKSATPKYTIDWYLKWVASSFVLTSMSIRGIDGLQMVDLVLSTFGVFGWLIVSIIWQDRALIMVNGVGLMFLIKNLITNIL